MTNLDFVIQAGIVICSLGSVWMAMLCESKSIQKAAPIVGLLAQPFWISQAVLSGQPGSLLVSSVFCLIYISAIWKNYFR